MKTFKAKDRYGAETEFILGEIGIAETNEADLQYKIAFSKSLSAGVLTRDRMIEEMQKNNIWTEEHQKELEDISKTINIKQFEFDRAIRTNENVHAIALELMQLRENFWKLIGLQQGPLINSCEGLSEVIRQDALMAARVRIKANNQRYWKNYTEYIKERDLGNTSEVIHKLIEIHTEEINEKRKEILLQCPERKWLEEQNVSNNLKESKPSNEDIPA